MSDSNRAHKLAAARKKLKEYQTKDKNMVAKPVDETNDEEAVVVPTSQELEAEAATNGFKESIDVIQVLISEKESISNELLKYKAICREKELANEELLHQHTSTRQRLDVLERTVVDQRQENESVKSILTKFKADLEQSNAVGLEQANHVQELKNELSFEKTRYHELEAKFKEVSHELEMKKIRIDQLSDEAHISADNRVESLTQDKFMYEQQIRDLQAMVQQYNTDKEQANQQYQNYVQHLNTQISVLTEKNSELSDVFSQAEEREKSLVEHISGLEKQIQQTMARQEQISLDKQNAVDEQHLQSLNEKIDNLQKDNSKLKEENALYSKEVENLNRIVLQNEEAFKEMEMQAQDRPDNDRLLATMESDKIAASRAISQNQDLKQQLDELQLRFVQLTNDKVDLTNRLDSEEHANKEIRVNFAAMEEKLKQLEEKLHFKDEEMIRLSHENNDLKLNNLELKQQEDRLKHYEAKEYRREYAKEEKAVQSDEEEEKEPVTQVAGAEQIPDAESVQKLQERFTKLMRQVADITDEKQRLEHLVLQLQGETETIGEYISLYQTQRRILKQREYERNAQLQRLLHDREDMQNKMLTLNKLVASLGIQIPSHYDLHSASTAAEVGLDATAAQTEEFSQSHVISSNDVNGSSDIIKQIEGIITEMKESSMQLPNAASVDHCSCCSGKLHTV